MAEAWGNKLAGDLWQVKSAGIDVTGIDTMTISVMREVDIDMSKQTSTKVNRKLLEWADVIVTLCENEEEQCPVINYDTLKFHLPLSSPAKFKGDQQALMAAYRQTRDKLEERIEHLVTQLSINVVR
ncbi:UNVERIFIED_CONTAM: hypothetical protein GTU68_011278 [Idotea baltica]|nr:hypothetical protein [Idotea baltica]